MVSAAVILVLVLVPLASASHHYGGVSTYTYKGMNPDGSYRVDVRNKDTYDGCHYSHYWGCYSGHCGHVSRHQRGTIDRSYNTQIHNNQWCETETYETRNLYSDRPFQMRAYSCCWVPTRNGVNNWNLASLVDLGNRSDTGEPNRSPDIAILPFLRVPQNCPRTYNLMAFDPDGDNVRCRYGNIPGLECSRCDQPSGFHLDQNTCTLRYQSTYSDTRVFGFEMVVEDFPQGRIRLTYSDGSQTYKGSNAVRRKRQATTSYPPQTTTAAGSWWGTTWWPGLTTTATPPQTTTSWWWTTTTSSATTTPTPTTTVPQTTSPWWWTTTWWPTTTVPTTTSAWWWTTTTTPPTTTAPQTTSPWWWTTTWWPTTTAPQTTTPPPTTTAPQTTSPWWWTTTWWPTTTAPQTTTPWWYHTTTTTTSSATTTPPPTTSPWWWTWTTTWWPTTTTPTTTAAPTNRSASINGSVAVNVSATTTTTAPTTTTTNPWWWLYTSTTRTTTAPTTTTTNSWWWWYSTTTQSQTTSTASYGNSPLSKLPMHFSVLVDPAAPSCQEGLYIPQFIYPTPEDRARIYAEVDRELEIRVKAQAAYATIQDIIMSGPMNITKHRTTQNEFVLRWTPLEDDLGDHFPVCFAVESVALSRVYQSDMRCVLVDTTKPKVRANVFCSESTMRVEVEKSDLGGISEDHLRLSDPTNTACSLQTHSNSTHVIAVVPLNACGTQIEEDEDNLIFKNEITTYDDVSGLITRKHLLEVQFDCQYPKKGNVTLGFSAHRKTVTVWEKGLGSFTYQFEFYPTARFSSMISPRAYPLEYDVGQRVYMEIEATSSVNNTEMFVESCRAAPYDSPNYPHTYSIIENGCPVDPTVQIHSPRHNTHFQFSMEAFKFIGMFDQVYISCSVIMCEAGNSNTRCSQGCSRNSTRHRRDAAVQTGAHFISQGPLRLRRAVDGGGGAGGAVINLNVAIMAACLLVAVAMVCGVVLYKARTSRAQYKPLPTWET